VLMAQTAVLYNFILEMITFHDIHISFSGDLSSRLSTINSGFLSGFYTGVTESGYLCNHVLREFNRRAESFGLTGLMVNPAVDYRAIHFHYVDEGGGAETFNIVQIGGDQILLINGENIILV